MNLTYLIVIPEQQLEDWLPLRVGKSVWNQPPEALLQQSANFM